MRRTGHKHIADYLAINQTISDNKVLHHRPMARSSSWLRQRRGGGHAVTPTSATLYGVIVLILHTKDPPNETKCWHFHPAHEQIQLGTTSHPWQFQHKKDLTVK